MPDMHLLGGHNIAIVGRDRTEVQEHTIHVTIRTVDAQCDGADEQVDDE